MRYAGLVYYEEKGPSEYLLTFTAVRKLDVLIEVYIFLPTACCVIAAIYII